jgi:hypothetical protein
MALRDGKRRCKPPLAFANNVFHAANLGRKLSRDVDFWPTLPPLHPTSARPGSPEKICELSVRLVMGRELWHPRDMHVDDFDDNV